MTDEYLDRSSLVARMKYYEEHTTEGSSEHYAYSAALREIRNAPAADVAPVAHGKWVHSRYDRSSEQFDVVKCSRCGLEAYAMAYHVRDGNYCPRCGARMDGGNENDP